MRRLFHIVAILLPLLSCVKETAPDIPLQEDGAPDARVTVTFSLALPHVDPATKALGETNGLQTLHLAIFGGSGYYKEYIQAELVSGPTPIAMEFELGSGEKDYKVVDSYAFQAYLKLSNTKRTIHFIGNGPSSLLIGKDKEILPNLLGEKETAYWQMMTLSAITAKKKTIIDDQGNEVEEYVMDEQGNYIISDETQAEFCFTPPEAGDPTQKTIGETTYPVKKGGIALIRNWAKIILKNGEGSNFTPISFAVYNVPVHGTILPYGGITGFIDHYQDLSFDDLYRSDGQYAYRGNLPAKTPFDSSVQDDSVFEAFKTDPNYVDPSNRVKRFVDNALDDDEKYAVYLYERPIPTDDMPPSSVIIYGYFRDPDAEDIGHEDQSGFCYYKVDLFDKTEQQYYPIFRNFKYQISIEKITAKGHAHARQAALSAGSADVSADVNAAHLTDISDGIRRMKIDPWLSKTFYKATDEGDVEELYLVFYKDINKDKAEGCDISDNCVEITLDPDNDSVIEGGRDGITIEPAMGSAEDDSTSPYYCDPSSEEYGWRRITFRINRPDEHVTQTQTMHIVCKATDPETDEEFSLYRDVVLTLLPKQPMRVSCREKKIARGKGVEQVIDISVPEGLAESMFPLIFSVEPKGMTLTPNPSEGNLPVVAGRSIDPNDDSPAYQFLRTLTWEDYKDITPVLDREDGSRWCTFSCFFKTNCDNSGTDVWVSNEYFTPDHDNFMDITAFLNPKFTSSIPKTADAPEERSVRMSFGVQKESNGSYLPVFLQLYGLGNPAWTMTGTDLPEFYEIEEGIWTFTPNDATNALNNELKLRLLVDDGAGDVSARIYTANDTYEPVTLIPWHFNQVRLVDAHYMPGDPNNAYGSNVVWGHVNSQAKNVLLGFYTDERNRTPIVSFPQGDLSSISPASKNSYDLSKDDNRKNPYGFAYSGDPCYYVIPMKSVEKNGNPPVSFKMTSPGYVEETITANRFVGNIRSARYTGNNVLSNFTSIALTECNAKLRFSNASGGAEPTKSSNGLVLEKGHTYNVDIELSGKDADKLNLYNIQFDYHMDNGKIHKHVSYSIGKPAESTFYQYPGSQAEWIWAFPQDCTYEDAPKKSANLQLKAPSDMDIIIRGITIKGFSGTIYD